MCSGIDVRMRGLTDLGTKSFKKKKVNYQIYHVSSDEMIILVEVPVVCNMKNEIG